MAMTTSSAPSLQVDLPGLSQLILNVGSHGLKQLALAGVDIHSIGCMLMIAEYTPASSDFRKKLFLARSSQRSERLWLYKVVEIGAATNFLADQLLKTRAGENVLALMAATVPVMDEETCTTALVALFEEARVSLDNIPGISQLRSLRTDLAPLARRVGFGEKVLNYHKFLWSLCGSGATMPGVGPYAAIPLAGDVAAVIRMLHRVVHTEEPYIFICWGFRGAAWITAYASEVLGLKVCAVQGDRTPIPVTGAYEDAKILIELSSSESRCGLYLKKNVEEQFELSRNTAENRRGWSVDCAVVHFLEYRHSRIGASESLARLSYFVAIETLNQVATLSTAMSAWTENRRVFENAGVEGFVTYAESELKHTQARALRILRQLGFIPGGLEDYKFTAMKGRETYMCHGHKSDPPPLYYDQTDEYYDYELKRRTNRRAMSRIGQYMVAGAAFDVTTTDRLRCYMVETVEFGEMAEKAHGVQSDFKHSFFELRLDKQKEIAATVKIATHFASYLAFSDWDVSLRQMSVQFLQFGETKEQRQSDNEYFEAHMSAAIPLCADNLDLSTLENKLWSADWVALDLDGIIVHRNTARHSSIHDLRGKFLGFTAGKIVSEGGACTKVRSDRVGLSYLDMASEITGLRIAACTPKLKFPNLSTRTLLSTVGDTLFVRLEGFLDSKLILVGDASRVGQTLPDALVSVPCPHGYYKETDHGLDDLEPRATNTLQTERVNMIIEQNKIAADRIRVIEGLVFDSKASTTLRNEKLHIYYQMVDNSPLGQWLACHWMSPNERALTIIQKDCCFGCILQRVRRLYEIIEDSEYPLPAEGLDVCVIPSGVRQQVLPQRAVSSSRRLAGSSTVAGSPSSLQPPRNVQSVRSSENLLRPVERIEAPHRRAVSSDSGRDTWRARVGADVPRGSDGKA